MPTQSGLALGVVGSLDGTAFTVVGRVRYGYPRGFWDEWCIELMDGCLRWLTEDDGILSVTEPQTEDLSVETYQRLDLGRSSFLKGHNYVVREKGSAECLGLEGQLPFGAIPGEVIEYISLSAGKSRSATLEFYDGNVHVYIGEEIQLEDLNLLNQVTGSPGGPTAQFQVASTDTTRMGCFACGAPLAASPGQAECICTYCGAPNEPTQLQIDCAHCNTRFGLFAAEHLQQAQCPNCNQAFNITPSLQEQQPRVSAIQDTQSESPAINHAAAIHPFKLGQKATFDGRDYVLTGFLRNEVVEEGISYYSESFHLLSKCGAARWLDREDGHFTLTQRSAQLPEDLDLYLPRKKCEILGRSYSAFDNGVSKTCWVEGQLTYSAQIGDEASYYDFIAPPYVLTAEKTAHELEGFHGRYIPGSEVAEGFGLDAKHFETTEGVAPGQPYVESQLTKNFRTFLPFYCLYFLLIGLLSMMSGTTVATALASFSEGANQEPENLEPFEITDTPTTISLNVDTDVDNSWVFLEANLTDSNGALVHQASATISYYHGSSGGESWSEGSSDHEFLLRLNEPGTYRFSVQGESNKSTELRLTVSRDVWATRYLVFGFIGSIIIVASVFLRRSGFESKRWSHLSDD